MEAFCLDLLHSDWYDYRGTGMDEDRLLKPGWLEQLAIGWDLTPTNPPDAETIAAFQKLRSLMQHIIQTLLQMQMPTEDDIATLNTYLDAAPTRPHLVVTGKTFQLQQVPLNNDWPRIQGEVAVSFANLLAYHDPTRIKQCENPDCLWIYYDESANQSRQWCEDTCANLMRVRRFRARRKNYNQAKVK